MSDITPETSEKIIFPMITAIAGSSPRCCSAADRLQVDRLPDPAKPDLLARLSLVDKPAAWTPLVRLVP
jgi:hypothetical protein